MTNHFREVVQELLDHIDNNPLTDEQIEKIEKCAVYATRQKRIFSR